jgi:hypothetical protein
MELARDIGLELEKPANERQEASAFAQSVMNRYDKAIKGATLPWYINGEQQFANINLLQSYLTHPNCTVRESIRESSSGEEEEPRVRFTTQDIAVMERVAREMDRLGSYEVDAEIGRISTQ